MKKQAIGPHLYIKINKFQALCACMCVCAYECTKVYTQYKYMFPSSLGGLKKQKGIKTSMWHGGYAHRKLKCFQLFMLEAIIM